MTLPNSVRLYRNGPDDGGKLIVEGSRPAAQVIPLLLHPLPSCPCAGTGIEDCRDARCDCEGVGHYCDCTAGRNALLLADEGGPVTASDEDYDAAVPRDRWPTPRVEPGEQVFGWCGDAL